MNESQSPDTATHVDSAPCGAPDLNVLQMTYAGRLAHAVEELEALFRRLSVGLELMLDTSQDVTPKRHRNRSDRRAAAQFNWIVDRLQEQLREIRGKLQEARRIDW